MTPSSINRGGPEAALRASSLSVAHPGAKKAALSGVNFMMTEGCRAALVGPNGCGKSTLLKTIAGLLKPAGGTMEVFGERARTGKVTVAYLAQRSSIEWHFPVTLGGLVLAGRHATRGWLARPTLVDKTKAAEAMERLKLTELKDRPIHALSGGQQQRALLARAICQEARVLLLDEPYSGLDSASREIMEEILFGKGSETLTVLMATHEQSDASEKFDMALSAADGVVTVKHACTCNRAPIERNP